MKDIRHILYDKRLTRHAKILLLMILDGKTDRVELQEINEVQKVTYYRWLNELKAAGYVKRSNIIPTSKITDDDNG